MTRAAQIVGTVATASRRARIVAAARAAALAIAVAIVVACAAACASGANRCVLVGYEKDGVPPERAHGELRQAMIDAERKFPAPAAPPRGLSPTDPEAIAIARDILKRRIDDVDASMRARGYRRVEQIVDCDGLGGPGAPTPPAR